MNAVGHFDPQSSIVIALVVNFMVKTISNIHNTELAQPLDYKSGKGRGGGALFKPGGLYFFIGFQRQGHYTREGSNHASTVCGELHNNSRPRRVS